MKNKNVGFLISGIAVLIIVIIILFNQGLTKIVEDTCTHGPTCPMYQTISTQTYLSLAIAVFVLIIGLFFISLSVCVSSIGFSKGELWIRVKSKLVLLKMEIASIALSTDIIFSSESNSSSLCLINTLIPTSGST